MYHKSDNAQMNKLDQKGFTLIELLIVVAIIGALAAVVIPNVGRFIGRGEAESADVELKNVQSAVTAMMVDNELGILPNPVNVFGDRTNNMGEFPDNSFCGILKVKDVYGNNFVMFSDKNGYILHGHDRIADGDDSTDLVNYVAANTSTYWYTVDTRGTIIQYDTGP